MTFGQYIDQLVEEGKAKDMDFAIAIKWTADKLPLEAAVEWLKPGWGVRVYPPVPTPEERKAGILWDEAWTIHRVAKQPEKIIPIFSMEE